MPRVGHLGGFFFNTKLGLYRNAGVLEGWGVGVFRGRGYVSDVPLQAPNQQYPEKLYFNRFGPSEKVCHK